MVFDMLCPEFQRPRSAHFGPLSQQCLQQLSESTQITSEMGARISNRVHDINRSSHVAPGFGHAEVALAYYAAHRRKDLGGMGCAHPIGVR